MVRSKKKRTNLHLTASTHLYVSEIYGDIYGAYENFKKCQGLDRQRKTITTANAFTSEICEHAKCLFISKGQTQAEDLKYHTALRIHTAFCWVMSGRCFAGRQPQYNTLSLPVNDVYVTCGSERTRCILLHIRLP